MGARDAHGRRTTGRASIGCRARATRRRLTTPPSSPSTGGHTGRRGDDCPRVLRGHIRSPTTAPRSPLTLRRQSLLTRSAPTDWRFPAQFLSSSAFGVDHHGKEGVSGSSPELGSSKGPQTKRLETIRTPRRTRVFPWRFPQRPAQRSPGPHQPRASMSQRRHSRPSWSALGGGCAARCSWVWDSCPLTFAAPLCGGTPRSRESLPSRWQADLLSSELRLLGQPAFEHLTCEADMAPHPEAGHATGAHSLIDPARLYRQQAGSVFGTKEWPLGEHALRVAC
jgi:hypothetical protein